MLQGPLLNVDASDCVPSLAGLCPLSQHGRRDRIGDQIWGGLQYQSAAFPF
jgi:hypothetical protein